MLHTCVIRCSVLFLVIFTKKENDINHFFSFVKMYLVTFWPREREISSVSASGNMKLIIRLWVLKMN